MKTKLLIISFILLSGAAGAQAILKAGVNMANVTITNDGDIDRNKSLTSFQLGITGDVKITSFFYFQPGILFTGKGSKTESGDPNSSTWRKATTNPFYVEVPANFVLKFGGDSKDKKDDDVRFFVGAGPYLGIGVAGKNKVNGKLLGTSFSSEEDITWSNDDPTTLNYEEGAGYGVLKRFDYGLNGLAGIEFSKVVLGVNYGFGLAKLQSGSNSSADDKNKHRVFSVTLGIRL
ncbi:MAG TPA: outer membrane beta-barrel protein [Chitinophagaceae bacterium]|nr:outer membrane beta-barrel protein [Chitinophagaceae bacterium]